MNRILIFILSTTFIFSCSLSDSPENTDSAISGSYSKLLTIGNYLYAINKENLATFDITDKANPVLLLDQNVGFRIENLFHSSGVLFIGSAENLHIFEIGNDGIPVRKNQLNYFDFDNMCTYDPVVVDGDFAYVTLSQSIDDNENCVRDYIANELRIYDISNLESPSLISTLNLNYPKGLAFKNNTIFVCEQENGVAVIDISDKSKPEIIGQLYGFKSYDVVIKNDLLIVVGPEEIREFNISDIHNIELYSSIKL